MALTWAGARTKVRGDLWKSATALPDDVCDRALHAALLQIESERRWLYLQNVSQSALTVAITSVIAAPANCKSIDVISYMRDGRHNILTLKQLAVVKRLAAETSDSWPTYYAFQNGNIHLDCTVPIGRQFYIVFKTATPNDTDAAIIAAPNVTLDTHQQAVIAHACGQIAQGRLRNPVLARGYIELYQMHLDRMIDADDEARADLGGPSIIPDTDYYEAAHGRGGY